MLCCIEIYQSSYISVSTLDFASWVATRRRLIHRLAPWPNLIRACVSNTKPNAELGLSKKLRLDAIRVQDTSQRNAIVQSHPWSVLRSEWRHSFRYFLAFKHFQSSSTQSRLLCAPWFSVHPLDDTTWYAACRDPFMSTVFLEYMYISHVSA